MLSYSQNRDARQPAYRLNRASFCRTALLVFLGTKLLIDVPLSSAQVCESGFRVQFEVRDIADRPVRHIKPSSLDAVFAGRELLISRLREFQLADRNNNVLSLLVLVMPHADITEARANELMRAIHREERVNWRIAVSSPEGQLSSWSSNRAEQEAVFQDAVKVAATSQPLLLSDVPSLDRWNRAVHRAVRRLLDQPGRYVILEVIPADAGLHLQAIPGDEALHTDAAFGNIPVYRWAKTVLKLRLSLPLGDASVGPPLSATSNTSSAELNEQQLGVAQTVSALQRFTSIRPFLFEDLGGRDVESERKLVKDIVHDSEGSYRFFSPFPSTCMPNTLFPLTLRPKSNTPNLHVYGPHWITQSMAGTKPY